MIFLEGAFRDDDALLMINGIIARSGVTLLAYLMSFNPIVLSDTAVLTHDVCENKKH
jgi:hypothetical protein